MSLALGALTWVRTRRQRRCGTVMLGVIFSFLWQGLAASRESVRFEIPAQSVAEALDNYSAATGLEVFYDGALAVGRRSNAVQGTLAPDVALRELLVGTGLVARATGATSFTLVPALSTHTSNIVYQSYFAVVQAKVGRALCARAETRPGDVDLIVRIWIAATGAVQQAQIINGSDAAATEPTAAVALRGLSIGPPPPDMPQPVTMAILARAKGAAGCNEFAAGVR